jgi:hypothetical protein
MFPEPEESSWPGFLGLSGRRIPFVSLKSRDRRFKIRDRR